MVFLNKMSPFLRKKAFEFKVPITYVESRWPAFHSNLLISVKVNNRKWLAPAAPRLYNQTTCFIHCLSKEFSMLKSTLAAVAAVFALSALSPAALAAKGDPRVLLTTSAGNIELELNSQKAPVSVKNFIDYVNSGFYNNTAFHRVIPGFMIQGGGFTEDMSQKQPNPPIKNEADNGLRNTRGTISMARTADKDSATSQFFINVADNAFLDHGQRDFGYAVFGKVINGMDIAEKISQVPTRDVGPYQNVPSKPIVILSAKVLP